MEKSTQNYIHEDVKSRLNLGKTLYLSDHLGPKIGFNIGVKHLDSITM
jgi:hypothetical protein